jgi:predicted acetyltransferase
MRYHRSLIDVVTEFDGARMDGAGALNGMSVEALRTKTVAAELIAELASDHDVAVADGSVRATSLWMVRDGELVGFLQIRHELTPLLLDRGGHVGYSVRPSARRQGLATRALAEAVEIARDVGLDRVLVACMETNPGSRAAIERNRGRYENSSAGLRRYWIQTGGSQDR